MFFLKNWTKYSFWRLLLSADCRVGKLSRRPIVLFYFSADCRSAHCRGSADCRKTLFSFFLSLFSISLSLSSYNFNATADNWICQIIKSDLFQTQLTWTDPETIIKQNIIEWRFIESLNLVILLKLKKLIGIIKVTFLLKDILHMLKYCLCDNGIIVFFTSSLIISRTSVLTLKYSQTCKQQPYNNVYCFGAQRVVWLHKRPFWISVFIGSLTKLWKSNGDFTYQIWSTEYTHL